MQINKSHCTHSNVLCIYLHSLSPSLPRSQPPTQHRIPKYKKYIILWPHNSSSLMIMCRCGGVRRTVEIAKWHSLQSSEKLKASGGGPQNSINLKHGSNDTPYRTLDECRRIPKFAICANRFQWSNLELLISHHHHHHHRILTSCRCGSAKVSFSFLDNTKEISFIKESEWERASERKKTFAINNNKSWSENNFCWFFEFVSGGWIALLCSGEGQIFNESEKTSAMRKLRSEFDHEAKRGGIDFFRRMVTHDKILF